MTRFPAHPEEARRAVSKDPIEAAVAEFTRRQAIARKAIEQGQWSEARAEAALRPWAALALMAGADLPQLRDDLAEERRRHARNWPGTPRGQAEAEARALLADEIAPAGAWKAALLAARDKALDRFTTPEPAGEAETARALPLVILANHFGLPGWCPPTMKVQEKEAA